ncbi:unnamed protein product [Protopolystoma xenopodis]|uniref:PH domain-containing protein n=1 Tax=Protopolystoma xenopodis TaxID=117903 RepID=A0A448WCI8_9PLAT|nr:unnamed protein product [Protopolystoma xenopodis]
MDESSEHGTKYNASRFIFSDGPIILKRVPRSSPLSGQICLLGACLQLDTQMIKKGFLLILEDADDEVFWQRYWCELYPDRLHCWPWPLLNSAWPAFVEGDEAKGDDETTDQTWHRLSGVNPGLGCGANPKTSCRSARTLLTCPCASCSSCVSLSSSTSLSMISNSSGSDQPDQTGHSLMLKTPGGGKCQAVTPLSKAVVRDKAAENGRSGVDLLWPPANSSNAYRFGLTTAEQFGPPEKSIDLRRISSSGVMLFGLKGDLHDHSYRLVGTDLVAAKLAASEIGAVLICLQACGRVSRLRKGEERSGGCRDRPIAPGDRVRQISPAGKDRSEERIYFKCQNPDETNSWFIQFTRCVGLLSSWLPNDQANRLRLDHPDGVWPQSRQFNELVTDGLISASVRH